MASPRFHALANDRRGSVVVEFALLIPVLLGLMLGIMQVGIGMQNYNALRAISADVARYAVVDAQSSVSRKTDTELETWATTRATGPIYHLHNANLTVDVADAATQRVPGATEKTITLTYSINSVLAFLGVGDLTVTYSRPVFLAP